MASAKFRIKTNNEWNSIYFRFKQGNQFDIELSTGIEVPKNRWSQLKQEILATPLMNYSATNILLKEFEMFINKEFHNSKLNQIVISSKWLKEKLSVFFNKQTNNPEIDSTVFFCNFIENFIEESKNRITKRNTLVKPRTIQHYNTTLIKIKEFEKQSNKILKLTDIDLKFHTRFVLFLQTVQKLNPNTIGGYIDDIKLFCSNADKRELEVSKSFKLSEFYAPTNPTIDVYLSEFEIDKIYDNTFEQDYLDNARDWLIIGVWTGLRVSDLLKLNNSSIENDFIYNLNEKTDYPAIIPIHPQVHAILKKRDGQFPRKISDQKFNTYIKEVCKLSGLVEKVEGAKISIIEQSIGGKTNKIHRKKRGLYSKFELISSHTCRRSFATNLYGKIDTLTIMKITGHKTESEFLKYIKVTPKEYAEKLKAHWYRNLNVA